MAYTKIHAIKATVDKAIEYICNPDKTDEQIYVSSYACASETAAIDFKYTLDHCRENSPNKAYHLIQAFKLKGLNVDKLRAEYQSLETQKKELTATYKNCEIEVRNLKRKQENLNQYLGRTQTDPVQEQQTKNKNHSL